MRKIAQVVQGRTRPVGVTFRSSRTKQEINLTGYTLTMTLIRARDNHFGEDFFDMTRGTGPDQIEMEGITLTADGDQTARQDGGNRGKAWWDPVNDGQGNTTDGSIEELPAGLYLAQFKMIDTSSDVDFAPGDDIQGAMLRVLPRFGEYSA